MKVLHVILTMDPAGGGPPVVAACLGAALAGHGHDVSIATCLTGSGDAPIRALLAGVPHGDRVKMELIGPLSLTERHLGLIARRAMPDLVAKADIIHCHGVWDTMLHVAAESARRRGTPIVVTPHGMLDPWSLSQGRLRKLAALRVGGAGRMLRGASLLHTLNADERTLIAPLGLSAPCHTIPNGVFVEQIDPLPDAGRFRASHPALGDDPFVLFLSRIHMKKGLDILGKAFVVLSKRCPNARLVVAGPDDGATPALLEPIRAASLENRTHLVGPIYGPGKYHALRDAACFCLPSRQEGFSMAITEAMGCRTPVVISDQCHFPEVADAGAGAVVGLDPVAVADACAQFVNDTTARDEAGRRGRSLVMSRYTWPSIGEQMAEAYATASTTAH